MTRSLQLSDELNSSLDFYEEIEVEPPEELVGRLNQAIAVCKRSVREAREAWETETM